MESPPDGRSRFSTSAFTRPWSSDWLHMPLHATAGAERRPHIEVHIPVLSSRCKRGCKQPFLHMLERSSKNDPPGSICPKRANGPRTTGRPLPMEGDARHVGH